MENKEGFSYTYSAKEQDEIKKIRQKYMPEEADKMEQLRMLDSKVTQKAAVASVSVGVIGALILGAGMSCVMVWRGIWFIPGIIMGFIGMAVLAAAYPIYKKVLKKEREKVAAEVIRLTDELMK